MKQLSTTLVLTLGLLTALGCDNRTDPITLMDSGPPEVDAGMEACGEAVGLPPVSCAESTRTCIGTCGETDEACFQACLDADPGMCEECLDFGIFSCQTRVCMTEYTPADCCAVANCDLDTPGAPCFEAGEPCEAEATAFRTCAMNAPAGGCGAEVQACFPAAGGFLPGARPSFEPVVLERLMRTLPLRASALQGR